MTTTHAPNRLRRVSALGTVRWDCRILRMGEEDR